MDTFGIGAAHGGVVRSNMPQALESDDGECVLCRGGGWQGNRSGEYRPTRRAFEQRVAPFRFGERFVADRNASCEASGEQSRIVALAVRQFDLDLVDLGVIRAVLIRPESNASSISLPPTRTGIVTRSTSVSKTG